MILEAFHLLDERSCAGPEHILEELERVPQPLAALAQRVEARQRRLEAAELPLEGPHDRHVLVEGPGQDLGDTLRTKVGRRARREALERPVQQLREALDEGAVAPAVEIVDEVLALTFALRTAGREQAVEIAGALGRQGVEVVLRLLLKDIEVAHRAQRASRTAQAFEDGAHRLAVQILLEDPQGHAHAPRPQRPAPYGAHAGRGARPRRLPGKDAALPGHPAARARRRSRRPARGLPRGARTSARAPRRLSRRRALPRLRRALRGAAGRAARAPLGAPAGRPSSAACRPGPARGPLPGHG